MKKIILFLAVAITFSGCTIEYRRTPTDHVVYAPTEYVETYPSYVEVTYESDMCWDDPYWHSEEWCDYYDDGTMCCVWYVDGWFEEWCQWDYDWCWEYNGSW